MWSFWRDTSSSLNSLNSDEVPEFLEEYNAPCDFMDIPEQYCFKVKQDNALRNTKTKKLDKLDIPDNYNRIVVLPNRMFKYHSNAKHEDILENAGGEERMHQSSTKQLQPGFEKDEVYGEYWA